MDVMQALLTSRRRRLLNNRERIISRMTASNEISSQQTPAPQENPNIVIYVLAYNDATFEDAKKAFPQPWFKPIIIPSTMYLENIMYIQLLMEHIDEWENADYVGTISYKAPRKMKVPDFGMKNSEISIEDPDVVIFWSSGEQLVKQAQRCHPQFANIWTKTMTNLGYIQQDFTDPSIKVFFSNYWMAKPVWMKKYIQEFSRLKDTLDNDPDILPLVFMDAKYVTPHPISTERCIEIFTKPYYTYHPFICERFSCFYFWKHGARLKDLSINGKR